MCSSLPQLIVFDVDIALVMVYAVRMLIITVDNVTHKLHQHCDEYEPFVRTFLSMEWVCKDVDCDRYGRWWCLGDTTTSLARWDWALATRDIPTKQRVRFRALWSWSFYSANKQKTAKSEAWLYISNVNCLWLNMTWYGSKKIIIAYWLFSE